MPGDILPGKGSTHTVVVAVVSTLVTIAIIKALASNFPQVPVLPTVAAHI